MERMSEEIFSKVLNNSATEAEKSNFYKLLEEDNALREIFYQYKNLNTISILSVNKDIQLQHDSFERFWNRVKPIKGSRMVHLRYRYAAVAENAATANIAVSGSLILKGGSVWLAAGHTIEFVPTTAANV